VAGVFVIVSVLPSGDTTTFAFTTALPPFSAPSNLDV